MDLSSGMPSLLVEESGNFVVYLPSLTIEEIAPLVTAVLAVLSMVLATCFIVKSRHLENVWVRLLGTLMVLCLALAANQWFVYFFAILVIATLITELGFLERVVALFWGRDKYWEWKMQSQSSAEVADKVKREVRDDLAATEADGAAPAQSAASSAQLVSVALAFERAVQAAIAAGVWPTRARKVSVNRKIMSRTGAQAEIDAIVVGQGANFVVEIRYSIRPSVFPNLVVALGRAVFAYSEYLFQRGVTKQVVPVAVVPAAANIGSTYRNMLVLRFDADAGVFANADEFRQAYKTWMAGHVDD